MLCTLILIMIASLLLHACTKSFYSLKEPPRDPLLGVSVGNGSLNASFNLAYNLTFPVNLSDPQINWSLLNTNFTAFITQKYIDYNITAYGQDNSTPCYILTNNGSSDIVVRVKVSTNSTDYSIYIVEGNNNITGSPSITLTTAFQNFVNLTVTETVVVNETNVQLVYNTTKNLDKRQLKNNTIVLFNTSSGVVINESHYTVNIGTGEITLDNETLYDNGVNVTDEANVLLQIGFAESFANHNLKHSNITIFNSTDILPSTNYSIDYEAGTITLNTGMTAWDGQSVSANYTYYPSVNVSANYTYYLGESKNVSCWGDYINFTLNNTADITITWNLTVI